MQWPKPGKVVPSRDGREDRQPHKRGQAQLNPDMVQRMTQHEIVAQLMLNQKKKRQDLDFSTGVTNACLKSGKQSSGSLILPFR